MNPIVHVAISDDWEASRNMGEYEVSTRGISLADAGYIRAATPGGVQDVVDRVFAGIRLTLMVVVLDSDALRTAGVPVTETSEPGGFRIEGAIPIEDGIVLAALEFDPAAGGGVPDLSRFGG